MNRFATLLHREWMQHHRGYLIMMLALPALGLALVAFASRVHIEPQDPLNLYVGATVFVTVGVVLVAAVTMAFQCASLARRDAQDRSIEFWLSLPVGHAQAIGATLVAHMLAMPLAALAVGFACSQAIAVALVSVASGPAALLALPWSTIVPAALAELLRNALGVVLALAWLSPLLLATMAASAWLKRWGVAALMLGLSIGNVVLAQAYGVTWVGDTVRGLLTHARQALLYSGLEASGGAVHFEHPDEVAGWLGEVPRGALSDGLHVLGQLADPLFLFAAAASAACFGLLVLRRRRSG